MCRPGDPVRFWKQDSHYLAEPFYVPRPSATAEDDGVLLTPVLDGARRASYLQVLNASTMTEMARVETPLVLPFSLHGQFV